MTDWLISIAGTPEGARVATMLALTSAVAHAVFTRRSQPHIFGHVKHSVLFLLCRVAVSGGAGCRDFLCWMTCLVRCRLRAPTSSWVGFASLPSCLPLSVSLSLPPSVSPAALDTLVAELSASLQRLAPEGRYLMVSTETGEEFYAQVPRFQLESTVVMN